MGRTTKFCQLSENDFLRTQKGGLSGFNEAAAFQLRNLTLRSVEPGTYSMASMRPQRFSCGINDPAVVAIRPEVGLQ